jgi:xylulokinase
MAFMGIDIGTSGTKVLLMHPDGMIAAKTTVEYPSASLHPMWSEQNPQDWWSAVCRGVRQVLVESEINGTDVQAVSFSGQMVGLVVLDEKGEVIRPCILWNDQRSAAVAGRLTGQIGLETILRETSNPLFASFVAPKLVWMRENEPENYARIRHVLLPKDYIAYKLTGRFATEVSDASGTCLFSVRERKWSPRMIAALDIPERWLPECLESEDPIGTIQPDAAAECGLSSKTNVIAGGGDQPVQAIGSGIVRAGRCSVTIGTSGVIFAQGDRHLEHPEGLLHSFCHSVRGQWYLMGVMLSAGGSLQWLRNTFRELADVDYTTLCDMAASAPPGSEGLSFLPYLTGERCPYNDPHARGGWIGLTQRHTLAHLVRAVLEGITFGLNDSLQLMREMGMTIDAVYASGGAVRSALWRQMLADVFGVPVITTNAVEGGAFGAALLAAAGSGAFKNVCEASDQLIRQTGITEPKGVTAYASSYEIYRGLYPALKATFDRQGGKGGSQ